MVCDNNIWYLLIIIIESESESIDNTVLVVVIIVRWFNESEYIHFLGGGWYDERFYTV